MTLPEALKELESYIQPYRYNLVLRGLVIEPDSCGSFCLTSEEIISDEWNAQYKH